MRLVGVLVWVCGWVGGCGKVGVSVCEIVSGMQICGYAGVWVCM